MPPDAPASPVNADLRPVPSGRRPLSQRELRAALVRPGSLWREVRVTESTGSTNADLAAHARRGGAEGTVLAAEVPASAWGWLPLLAGLAVVAAVRGCTGVDALLKWPNDVMAEDRKLAGILAEQAGEAVVIGIGLNVFATRAELPVARATSLVLEGAASPDRNLLLAGILREMETRYRRLARPGRGRAPLREEYLDRCCTL